MVNLDERTAAKITAVYGHVPESLAVAVAGWFADADANANADADADADANRDDVSNSTVSALWDHRDVVLITYADQIRDRDNVPITAQLRFLLDHRLDELIRCVHFLPFCPSTSDDGFSVVDYLRIDPEYGDWPDIAEVGRSFDLMFDLVLNHCSQQHDWFQRFLRDDPDADDFFVTADPADDLSSVMRPRALPLLTPFVTPTGTKHVWTTFSADQVDWNYKNPLVMTTMIDTLVQYARRGARVIRLDAIAFLWKQIGTSCMHLPPTHAAVALMRHVLDRVAPGTLVLTETNVPHAENISYFGDGTDEAHMVYQFSLPPLLLDAIHSGDTGVIRDWMKTLRTPSPQTTFFNFTASHDGIGVRPAEGLLPPERIDALAEIARAHGGRVGMRSNADGSQSPYELNITYLDAVADRKQVTAPEHSRRFLATQAIMLSMRGMPAIYFHSLVGSPGDAESAASSGIPRRINRHKYQRDELDAALAGPDSLQRRVFDGYRRLLAVRRDCPAFDPAADQTVLDLPSNGLLGFIRAKSTEHPITVLANLTDQARRIRRDALPIPVGRDILAVESLVPNNDIVLRPFQVRWLSP